MLWRSCTYIHVAHHPLMLLTNCSRAHKAWHVARRALQERVGPCLVEVTGNSLTPPFAAPPPPSSPLVTLCVSRCLASRSSLLVLVRRWMRLSPSTLSAWRSASWAWGTCSHSMRRHRRQSRYVGVWRGGAESVLVGAPTWVQYAGLSKQCIAAQLACAR